MGRNSEEPTGQLVRWHWCEKLIISTSRYEHAMKNTRYATPFSLLHAASLLNHRSRIAKFRAAIERTVTNDSLVVDLGTGSGVLALIAARAGARKVVAIDISAESVAYARMSAVNNRLERNMQFVQSHYSDYRPREKADVVLCEMLSSMLLVEQQVPAALHARRHILKREGVIIPRSVTAYVVPTQCDELWNRFETEGFVFPRLPQTVQRGETLDLADACEVARFDFRNDSLEDRVDSTLEFRIVEDGVVHGLAGMSEADLLDGITLKMEDGWQDIFVPLEEPVPVKRGDDFTIRIRYIPGQYDSILLTPK